MPASYADHRRFCEIDGWEQPHTGEGGGQRQRGGDHDRYRKVLADGRILRTKVSHGRGEYRSPGMWRHIWRDQLGLEREEELWEALKTGKPVERDPPPPAREDAPEAWLIEALVGTVGLSEDAALKLSQVEALRRWLEYCERH